MILLALSGLAVACGYVSPFVGSWIYESLQRTTVIFEALLESFLKVMPAPIEIAAPNACVYYCGFAMLWTSRKRPWLAFAGLCTILAAWLPAFR
jgi:hypothetical protein